MQYYYWYNFLILFKNIYKIFKNIYKIYYFCSYIFPLNNFFFNLILVSYISSVSLNLFYNIFLKKIIINGIQWRRSYVWLLMVTCNIFYYINLCFNAIYVAMKILCRNLMSQHLNIIFIYPCNFWFLNIFSIQKGYIK